MINIQTHGKYTQPIKVLSVESVHEKVNQVKVEGLQFPLKVWKSQESKFGTKLEAGAQAEAVVEVKAQRNGSGNEAWIESFGGVTQNGKFGGGRAFTPKSPAEIHAGCISGILKSCIESCETVEQADAFAVWAVKTYRQAMKAVCEVGS